ncbi:MAG: ArsR/SmtB family transcription factor [Candidatus Aenigmatarchaeota archaeon]
MQSLKNVSKILKALSSEQRLRIVENLLEADKFKCYCEMDDIVDKDTSVIYRHFKKLEEADVIETRKKGKKLEGRVKNPEKVKKLLEIAEGVSPDES